MKTIKIKVKDIKSNPFKKFINVGKLNQEIVNKLVEGYKQTTFHQNLNARESEHGEVELIYGHHRLEAVKQVYGNNFEITLNVYSYKEFSDENMLLDMIRENLTQRDTDYKDMADSIMLAKHWLESEASTVNQLYSTSKGGYHTHKEKQVGARQIADFISKQGKTLSHVQVSKVVKIEENLTQEIKKIVIKGDRAGQLSEGKIGFEVASKLAEFDKKEQKLLLPIIKESKLNKDEIKASLVKYKESEEEIKEKVRKGKIDLEDIENEAVFVQMNKLNSKKEKTDFSPTINDFMSKFKKEFNICIEKMIFIYDLLKKIDNKDIYAKFGKQYQNECLKTTRAFIEQSEETLKATKVFYEKLEGVRI